MKTQYLILYNALSAALWVRVLYATLTTDVRDLYSSIEPWARWTQTLAVAEILHAALGITRAAVFTTFTQVFTRCVQVWAITGGHPQLFTRGSSTASEPGAYAAMLFAWSLADVLRYSYFVVLLAGGGMPRWLEWLRYSLFYVLYPVGIGSEWWLMYAAARETEGGLSMLYYFLLVLYVPGAIMMYSHMMKQRQKTLYGKPQ